MTWTIGDAAHLLRRAGFGGSSSEVSALFAKGRDAAIDHVVDFEALVDPAWDKANPLALQLPTKDYHQATITLLYRLLASTRPLQARLTWFWHGHFTSSLDAAGPELISRQMATWRSHATGNFRDFLLAMYKDGAMLRFLDGDPSTKEGPNENFARENLELFTMGTGPYTEKDVRECARAFTGWDVGYPDPKVSFHADAHDFGSKTILRKTGHFNGDDVMRMLSERSETRWRICVKLYRHFVRDPALATGVLPLIEVWKQTDGNLKAVLRALFKSEHFWHPSARRTLVKDALEYTFGLIQKLGHPPTRELLDSLAWRLSQMGQAPFNPPNPSGYPTGIRLTNASMLQARYQFADYIIYEVNANRVVSRATLGMPAGLQPRAFITWLANWLGIYSLTPITLASLLEFLGSKPIDTASVRTKTLDTLYLLACSPEYQLS